MYSLAHAMIPLRRPATTTPRIFSADPDVCVPCQCHSAQARSSWIVEATKVARKSGTWANKPVQFSRTWVGPVKALSGCSGCSPLKSLAKQLTNASMSCVDGIRHSLQHCWHLILGWRAHVSCCVRHISIKDCRNVQETV